MGAEDTMGGYCNVLRAHEDYLLKSKEAALELKSYLTKLHMSLEKDIAKRKELLDFSEGEAVCSPEEIKKEKEEIAFLESICHEQLYRQLTRWIKFQEKIKDGPPRKKRKRGRNRSR
tara:strand:- start:7066 stop:7416 length:351 start_codon:yes stop_codon:yes gene_type:complete